jgi:DNA-binding CsgD family transcriptional regulator
MSVSFSSADLSRMARLSATLLSPLDAPSIDAWRRDACLLLRELVGGDKVYMLGEGLPVDDILWCDGFPDDLAEGFRANFRVDEGLRRALRIGSTAFNQTTIVAGDWAGYERDPMVNEVYRPNGVNDVIGLMSEVEAVDCPAERSFRFMLGAGHPEYGSESFGDKGLCIMRLLAPSFEAGVSALLATAEWRHVLGGVLDALDAAAWVFPLDARTILHRNSAASQLMAEDRQGTAVETHVRAVAIGLARAAHPAKSRTSADASRPPVARVSTASATYSVKGSYLGAARLWMERSILVVATRVSSRVVDWSVLQRTYALTPREVEVAQHLYGGLRASDVANRLGTSARTVHHHIERLYMKLGVHSRGEAQRLIREF